MQREMRKILGENERQWHITRFHFCLLTVHRLCGSPCLPWHMTCRSHLFPSYRESRKGPGLKWKEEKGSESIEGQDTPSGMWAAVGQCPAAPSQPDMQCFTATYRQWLLQSSPSAREAHCPPHAATSSPSKQARPSPQSLLRTRKEALELSRGLLLESLLAWPWLSSATCAGNMRFHLIPSQRSAGSQNPALQDFICWKNTQTHTHTLSQNTFFPPKSELSLV